MRISSVTGFSRASLFVVSFFAVILLPNAIPTMGASLPFTFTVGLVLLAWLTMKWSALKSLTQKGHLWEILFGAAIVVGNFVRNFLGQNAFGLVDMLLTFVALAIAFYGIRAMRLFVVPSAYILILILGYQIENVLPQAQVLEYWLASLMGNMMQALGVQTAVNGNVVTLFNASSPPLALQVEGPCTGLKGIIAFGMLGSMAVLDVKTKISRMVPILALGFLGAFLINIVRLFGVFLTFEYLGVDWGTLMHVYLGYSLFIAWVVVFWMIAFKLMIPKGSAISSVAISSQPPPLIK